MTNDAKHMLLIDDDDINNFLTSEIITMHMPLATIDSFTKAEDALEYIQQKLLLQQALPDIILLDINMPIMDGWGFLKALDQLDLQKFLNTKVFLYTSSVYHQDQLKAQNFSIVKKLFVKPFSEYDLAEMIAD